MNEYLGSTIPPAIDTYIQRGTTSNLISDTEHTAALAAPVGTYQKCNAAEWVLNKQYQLGQQTSLQKSYLRAICHVVLLSCYVFKICTFIVIYATRILYIAVDFTYKDTDKAFI